MYYACKKYLQAVDDMKVETRTANGNNIKSISGWKNKAAILNELAKIEPLSQAVRKFYETIPVMYRDQDRFDITASDANKYIAARNELLNSMRTIINLYESINTPKSSNDVMGIDIKLPQFNDISEFSKCLQDLDFVIKQCPYLQNKDAEIKYSSVDVGSTWLTFFIIGAAGAAIIKNLCSIIDYAVKIKSHFLTVKAQEEALRSLKLKNDIMTQVTEAFDKANNVVVQNCVEDLERELGTLKDGEERGKVGKSLEKLGFWMDKGLQIYSAIDAPDEIKDLFPEQEEMPKLSDDLVKLIEMKKENK